MMHGERIRKILALLLAAGMVWGSVCPGRAMAAEEAETAETEAAFTETQEETAASAQSTEIPAEEGTSPAENAPDFTEAGTVPTETATAPRDETTPTEETVPEETRETEPTETLETVPEETRPSPKEQLTAQMQALAEEAALLEADVQVLDAFAERLREVWNSAYDLNEAGLLSDEELSAIDELGWEILDDLKETYRYEDGVILPLDLTRYGSRESPLPATADNSVTTLGNSSGIKFRIFNYTNGKDETGNYITAGGINDNGLSGYFDFRGTSYENTGADGGTVSNVTNSTTDIDGYTANHATVLPNLGSGGYPVFDGSRDNGPQKSLGYLFGAGGRGVTAYTAANTLLRLNEQGQYYYNSADNAVDFDTASGRFIVRKYRERGQTTANQGTGQYYDFFPFTYWDGTTKGNADSAHWYNYNNTAEVDYWYGMTMEAAFSMPAGGIVNSTDDMIFSFSGDDDVWVFIDDVLVLDLGGTHGVVSGSINFATGEVKQYLDWGGATESSASTSFPTTLEKRFAAAKTEPNGGWSESEGTQGKIFADYSEHTIKFYYLERATSCANCRITFNMPILPTEKLTVEKRIEGTQTAVTEEEAYQFALVEIENGTERAAAGIRFDVLDAASNAVIASHTTGSGGEFALKAGQKAEFNLTAGKTFLVKETDTGDYADAACCTVNGAEQTAADCSEEMTIDPGNPLQVVFTNRLKTTQLTVRKRVAGNMGDRNQLFAFTGRLYADASLETPLSFPAPEAGEDYAVQNGTASFRLKHGETGITLDDLPVGAYVVITEAAVEGYETMYETADKAQTGTSARIDALTEPEQVTFLNTREVLIGTGVPLERFPYTLMAAGSAAGFLMTCRRKKERE
nr:fibro-slime domain-containing protein [Oscillospiraceae bacterium]